MTRYEQGFMNKCAEHGVDGRPILQKLATSAGHEFAGGTIASLIPYIGSTPHGIGSIIGGLRGRDLTEDELEEYIDKSEGNAKNYIPGVAGYRIGVRMGQLANKEREIAQKLKKKNVRPLGVMFSESLGATNPINWVASPIGALIAASRKHRTLEEQVEHDSKIQWIKNLLVPGYAGYHSALRLGASRDVIDNKKKDKDSKKKDKDSKNNDEA